MGLDIDFSKVPKAAVNETVLEVHERYGALSEDGCGYVIDYHSLADNPEKEDILYFRKWHDIKNTMDQLFDTTGQCDFYLLNKSDVDLLLKTVEGSDQWEDEGDRLAFIAEIKDKFIDFPFDTHYLTYSWVS